jgi:predicted O-linked N-acetylglucosamine transferase (SPINDLY family)
MTNRTDSDNANTESEKLIALGQQLEDSGKLSEAEYHYRQALAIAPNPANAYLNLGNIFLVKNDPSSAKDQYLLALKHNPKNGGAYANLGRIHLIQNNFIEAAQYFKQAAELLSPPEKAEAKVSLGYALTQLNQSSEAERAYREALATVPDHPFANLQLGRLLMLAGKPVEATDHLTAALKMMPDNSNAHSWLGKVLSDQGFIPEACQHMAMAKKLNPQDIYNAGMSVFTLNYLPDLSSDKLFDAQQAYVERFLKPYYPHNKIFANTRHPEKKLKVGYVSSDFRKHPVSKFIEPLLKTHNRQLFEIHCFYTHTIQDATTQELISLTDKWHEISGIDDPEATKLIKNLGIDLLIDLNGLTHGHRLGVFARKPAPVQLTWLGYLGTTGLETMDYRICDYYTDPPGSTEKHHSEKLARMPNSQWCHAPYKDLPPIKELPLLQNDYITFGSFNNVAKLNDEALRLWAQLLSEIPNSRIRFAAIPSGRSQKRIIDLFDDQSIERERIKFIPRLQYQEYLRAISDVDIGLDPFPYNGGTTSFDILIMGVPYITMTGERSISRGGSSILSNLGLSEMIASTPSDFIAKARKLANSPSMLRELRASLRDRLNRSPLMDIGGFTHDIEQLYRNCWREWCKNGTSQYFSSDVPH